MTPGPRYQKTYARVTGPFSVSSCRSILIFWLDIAEIWTKDIHSDDDVTVARQFVLTASLIGRQWSALENQRKQGRIPRNLKRTESVTSHEMRVHHAVIFCTRRGSGAQGQLDHQHASLVFPLDVSCRNPHSYCPNSFKATLDPESELGERIGPLFRDQLTKQIYRSSPASCLRHNAHN